MSHHHQTKLIQAALLYFAMVLGTGFVLGVVRVPFVVPRLGERWAELAEMPLMALVIYLSAGYLLKRYPEVGSPRRALGVGLAALALSVCAELGLALAIQSQSLADYIASRDKVSGSVYLAMLVVFALMPWLRVRHSPSA
jgi:uncharacterized transporter YbjL